MALSNKALQRKREKKKKKRQVKISNLFPTNSTEIAYDNWPIHECWLPIELWNIGMGQVIISRRNYQNDIAVAIFLIDTYCLGIKDCFVHLTNMQGYQNILDHTQDSCGEMELVDATEANTLIIKSGEYANQLGFKPHNDFLKARAMLRGIALIEDREFSFGRDGKPFYTQGPSESPADVKRILNTLASSPGDKSFQTLIELPSEIA